MIRLRAWAYIATLLWMASGPGVATSRADDFQVNTYTTSYQLVPSVGLNANGDFVVVWESDGSTGTDSDSGSIQGQRYASDGSAVGAEFQINTYTTDLQDRPSVALGADGDFVVVWDSNGSAGTDSSASSIQGQRYASDGSPLGPEFQVNTSTGYFQNRPSVALGADGDFVVVWFSNDSSGTDLPFSRSVQGQRFASDGSAVGTEFQVNTYTTDFQQFPSVALSADGDFVVVWQSVGSAGTDSDGFSVQGQRYASDGSAVDAEFQVNTYTTARQTDPSVGSDADGDFVVVWQSEGSAGTDSDGSSVQGQRYASDGSAVGAEFQVNTYTTNTQVDPTVSLDADGNFVVVWTSFESGTDLSPRGILGQRYASDGSTIGGEFQVNSYTTSDQSSPSVALSDDGNFVAAWSSIGSGSADSSVHSIQARRFQPPPPVLCAGLPSTIVGTAGDDPALVGTSGDDVIHGLDGDDVISGRGGNDVICGGSGNDDIKGGGGDDILLGENGDDTILGGPGQDMLMGGRDSDTLSGNGGDDFLSGEAGDDQLLGGLDNDTLVGGLGNDVLKGGPGIDDLSANGGDDRLLGGPGDDLLKGGTDNDNLIGGDDVDVLKGGPGTDVCDGETEIDCE